MARGTCLPQTVRSSLADVYEGVGCGGCSFCIAHDCARASIVHSPEQCRGMHACTPHKHTCEHACMHACMRTSGHLLYTHMHASGTPPPLRVYVCEYGCIPCSRLWKQMRSGVWHICATGRTSLDSRCAVDTCIGCHGVGGGRCGKEVCRLGSALVNFGILQTAGEYERWQARGLFRGRSYVPTWLAHVACNIQVTVLSNMGSSSTKPS